MPNRPLSQSPSVSAGGVDDIARAKAARAFFYEFWNTGDENLLKQAFTENLAGKADPPRTAATIGLWPDRRLGAPDEESI